jgi:Flp pilus assembly protein TadG
MRDPFRDGRGSATIEFALLTCFFFAVVLGALDFGMFFIQRSDLSGGVSTASIHSFANRDAVAFANIPAMVTAASKAPGGSAVSVTVTCNAGTASCVNTNRVCACLTSANAFIDASSCGAPCTGGNMTSGSTAGYYLTIAASYPYAPAVLPRGALGSATVRQTAVVRLQ